MSRRGTTRSFLPETGAVIFPTKRLSPPVTCATTLFPSIQRMDPLLMMIVVFMYSYSYETSARCKARRSYCRT